MPVVFWGVTGRRPPLLFFNAELRRFRFTSDIPFSSSSGVLVVLSMAFCVAEVAVRIRLEVCCPLMLASVRSVVS